MTTNNSILVTNVRSNKSENMVWAVYAQGNEQATAYCKSPYKAMRMAFLLKKQTGLYISDICLARLSLEIRKLKEATMSPEQVAAKEHVDELVEEFIEEHSVDKVFAKADEEKAKGKAKGKGKRKASKKQEKVAA